MDPSAPGAIRYLLYLFFNWGNRDSTGEMPGVRYFCAFLPSKISIIQTMTNKISLRFLMCMLLYFPFQGNAQQLHLDTIQFSKKPMFPSGFALDALTKCVEQAATVDSLQKEYPPEDVLLSLELFNRELKTKVFTKIDAVVQFSVNLESPDIDFDLYECTIIDRTIRASVIEKLGHLRPDGQIMHTIAPLAMLWRERNQKIYLFYYGIYRKSDVVQVQQLFDCMIETVR